MSKQRFNNLSKFRHVVFMQAKKEDWYTFAGPVIATAGSDPTPFKVNQKWIACKSGTKGTGIRIFPLSQTGKQPVDDFTIQTSSTITDLDWSPFHRELLVSGHEDQFSRIWKIPESSTDVNPHSLGPHATLQGPQKRIEVVQFNTTTDNILASGAFKSIYTFDMVKETPILCFDQLGDTIQSLSWNNLGSLIGSTCKDNIIRIVDPRLNKTINSVEFHTGAKPSRLIWGCDLIITTGFSKTRERECAIWVIMHFIFIL